MELGGRGTQRRIVIEKSRVIEQASLVGLLNRPLRSDMDVHEKHHHSAALGELIEDVFRKIKRGRVRVQGRGLRLLSAVIISCFSPLPQRPPPNPSPPTHHGHSKMWDSFI